MGGCIFHIAHPASADALIDESEFERDERLPYWADLWPSATALGWRLFREDLAGKRVIELGCGVGLPGTVALYRDAEVLFTDHYPAALDFAAYNARVNTGGEPRTALLDWHKPENLDGLGTFELVIAADVLYERRNAPALAALIPGLLAPGGEALLADPRRKDTGLFLELMGESGFSIETEDAAVEQGGREVTVRLHRLRRK